jgi:hypothetical protein
LIQTAWKIAVPGQFNCKEIDMTEQSNRGGTHEQHVKAGEQSHKNAPPAGGSRDQQSRGGSPEQNAKAGEQSRKNEQQSGTRGGSHEQHVRAGEQSHKNT